MQLTYRQRRQVRRRLRQGVILAAQWVAFFVFGSLAVFGASHAGAVFSGASVEAANILAAIGVGLVAIIVAIGWLCSVLEG